VNAASQRRAPPSRCGPKVSRPAMRTGPNGVSSQALWHCPGGHRLFGQPSSSSSGRTPSLFPDLTPSTSSTPVRKVGEHCGPTDQGRVNSLTGRPCRFSSSRTAVSTPSLLDLPTPPPASPKNPINPPVEPRFPVGLPACRAEVGPSSLSQTTPAHPPGPCFRDFFFLPRSLTVCQGPWKDGP